MAHANRTSAIVCLLPSTIRTVEVLPGFKTSEKFGKSCSTCISWPGFKTILCHANCLLEKLWCSIWIVEQCSSSVLYCVFCFIMVNYVAWGEFLIDLTRLGAKKAFVVPGINFLNDLICERTPILSFISVSGPLLDWRGFCCHSCCCCTVFEPLRAQDLIHLGWQASSRWTASLTSVMKIYTGFSCFRILVLKEFLTKSHRETSFWQRRIQLSGIIRCQVVHWNDQVIECSLWLHVWRVLSYTSHE